MRTQAPIVTSKFQQSTQELLNRRLEQSKMSPGSSLSTHLRSGRYSHCQHRLEHQNRNWKKVHLFLRLQNCRHLSSRQDSRLNSTEANKYRPSVCFVLLFSKSGIKTLRSLFARFITGRLSVLSSAYLNKRWLKTGLGNIVHYCRDSWSAFSRI